MFVPIDAPRIDAPSTIEASTHVEGTQKYEGKDNPGGGFYEPTPRKKKEKKKPKPQVEGHIDVLA